MSFHFLSLLLYISVKPFPFSLLFKPIIILYIYIFNIHFLISYSLSNPFPIIILIPRLKWNFSFLRLPPHCQIKKQILFFILVTLSVTFYPFNIFKHFLNLDSMFSQSLISSLFSLFLLVDDTIVQSFIFFFSSLDISFD